MAGSSLLPPGIPPGMLDRKALRDLWQLRGPAVAIAVVVICGVASFVGMRSMVPHLTDAQSRYYASARFADLWVPVKRAPRALLPALQRIPGMAEIELRVTGDIILDVPGLREPASGHLIGIRAQMPPAINRLTLQRGRLLAPGRTDEIILSEGFANANHLLPGDSLGAVLHGRWRMLHVVGIALTPEYVLEMRPGDLFPDSRRYGVLWIDATAAESAFGMTGAWNEAVVRLTRDASAPAVRDALDQMLAPYGALGAYGRELQASHRFLSDEIRQARTFATIAPLIFLSVSAFLLNLVLARLVTSQREQIGMLKAFGVRTRELARHYVLIALGPVIPGAILGTLLGLWLAGVLAALYAQYYRIPRAPFTPHLEIIVIAVAITLIAAVLGAVQSVQRVVRLPAAEAMRPESPTVYRPGVLEHWPILQHFSLIIRLTIRGIERQPMRAGLSLLGMALSVAIMMIGVYAFDAIHVLRDIHFTEAQREDLAVTFPTPQGDDALRNLQQMPGVLHVEPTWAVPVRLSHAQQSRQVALMAVMPAATLRRVVDRHRREAALPADGLLISRALADLLMVNAGDTLQLQLLVGRRRRLSVRLGATIDDLVGTTAYLPQDAMRAVVGDGAIDGAVMRVSAQAIDTLYRQLKHTPGIAGVASRRAVVENFDRVMAESFNVTLMTMAIFALALSIGVIYNTARIALSERGRELASLRVLGFTQGEVARMLFGELSTLGLAAIPCGFLIGLSFCWLMSTGLSSELFRLPRVVSPRTFGIAAGTLLSAGLASALLVRHRLNRLDLVAALKTRE